MTFSRLQAKEQWQKQRSWAEATVYHLLAILIGIIFLAPLYWMISASLRQPGLPPPRTIEWLPAPIVWANYGEIFALVPMSRYIGNSLWVAGLAVGITLVTASWAGFALAQLPARVRSWLVTLAVLLMLTPSTALWLPRFVIFKELGLMDSFGALVAPAVMGSKAWYVLLFYWTFRRMPLELYESARLDGAHALRIWSALALPLARATVIAVGILTATHYWSDFVDPLLYLKSESRYTLAVGLRILQQMDLTNWPILMGGATVMTLPVVLLFLVVQRYSWPDGRLTGLHGR